MITVEDLANAISSWYFINIGIPFIAAFSGVFVKVVSRKDSELKFKRDDWAIGFDIALGALFIFITKMVSVSKGLLEVADPEMQKKLQAKIISMPLMLIVWGVGFWAISTIIRKWGWEERDIGVQGKPKIVYEPSTWVGIIIPFLFGLVSLIFALNWTGGEQ
jgi:hypothetical protein